MTREEIIAKAKYIQFPDRNLEFKQYDGVTTTKIEMCKDDFYNTWKLNEHHFSPMVHFKKTMPAIAKLLDFYFNEDDFSFKPDKFENFDLTMPYPKASFTYDVKSLSAKDSQYQLMTYSKLTSTDGVAYTKYHDLYRYFHDSSIVINRNTSSRRTLLISGDSHMIPVVPMLTVYFKTLVYIDNRKNVSVFDKIKDINFTDVLFELYKWPLEYYQVNNLK